MAKKKIVKGRLKDGESITGELVEVNERSFTLEDKDGKQTIVPCTEGVSDAFTDFEGDQVKITCVGKDYEIEEID